MCAVFFHKSNTDALQVCSGSGSEHPVRIGQKLSYPLQESRNSNNQM